MKRLPLDYNLEEMLVCAERYALGRRTYVAGDTARYLMWLMADLSHQTLIVLLRDLSEALATERRCPDYKAFGDNCDRVEWMRLARAIGEELKKRSYTPLNNDDWELLTEAERMAGGRTSC